MSAGESLVALTVDGEFVDAFSGVLRAGRIIHVSTPTSRLLRSAPRCAVCGVCVTAQLVAGQWISDAHYDETLEACCPGTSLSLGFDG